MDTGLLEALQKARANKRPVCLVSSSSSGSGALYSTDALPEDAALSDAVTTALKTDRLQSLEVNSDNLFCTPFNPPVEVFIIGAVHISQALLPILEQLAFDVTVIDPRYGFAREERFPNAKLVREWPDEAMDADALHVRAAVITLTHDPKLDDPALTVALRSEAFYIGSLGSTRTHAKRVSRLQDLGFSNTDIGRIHAPVGMNIGARSPAEIACSIAAQLIHALRGSKP